MITRRKLKVKAKENLKDTWLWNTIIVAIISVFALSIFLVTVLSTLKSVINLEFDSFFMLAIASIIQVFLLVIPTLIGSTKYYLGVAKGKKPGLSIAIEPFQDFMQNIKSMLLISMIYILVAVIICFMIILSIDLPIIGFPLLVVTIIGGIYVKTRLSFTLYFYAEDDESIIDAMIQSWDALDGNVLQMFLLDCSFISWVILTVMTFGTAGIYGIPYIGVTKSMYFTELNY